MSSPTPVKRSLASLHLPVAVPAFIALGKSVVQSMTNNPSFPTPDPPLATVSTAISDLETAETAAKSRVHGAVTTRNEKRAVVAGLLVQLKAYVDKVAAANVENGASIIQSAGLQVRKPRATVPRTFAAHPGAVSGAVKLVTPSAGHRVFYEWQYSTDGGKTWLTAPSTLTAKTTISGLTPAAMVTFRYRSVSKAGEGDWSQPVSIIVK